MENKMSFEEACNKLQEIIDKIENGDVSLEEALTLFSQGEELVKICYQFLNNAKGQLSQIKETLGKLEEI